MTTSISDRDRDRRLREIDERAQRAWGAYRESVRDLEGRDYEDAEDRSWGRLQRKLAELDEQRAEIDPEHDRTGQRR